MEQDTQHEEEFKRTPRRKHGAVLQNQAALVQTQATFAQTQAALVQNQVLFVARVEELKDRMDQKFAEVDKRMDQKFAQIDKRLDRLEAIFLQKLAELPEKVFGFAQAAQKESG